MKRFALSFLLVMLVAVAAFAQGYEVGDKARDFSLKNVDGKMVSMKGDSSAKGYILAFTCNSCPFAQAYEQRIIALHQKYAAKGYPVIAINPNDPEKQPKDSFEAMQKVAKSKSYPFAYVMDNTQEIARAYGAVRTPHLFIVKKYGSDYKVEYIGTIDDNANDPAAVNKKYVEDAMNSILAGNPVQVSETKAIGCGIKWKDA
ncbi:Peroxiredoxin [Catalinimonas alkaloidigena]|uniref:Peroxiredoxin n=1 Tax=Catalinimonas alkaloidigena TaxID=1075417 RepID=A0A1G9EAK4_9BACT|nr:thioredoxin family protein [Catalinimonas alkaloidigena]SDK73086.1 Peroxiredoxin [Catalinimonas alkaloidigena]